MKSRKAGMKNKTTWGSVNAEDMYEMATRFAGFDRFELMREITLRTMKRSTMRVNENTVCEAMQTIMDRQTAEDSKVKV